MPTWQDMLDKYRQLPDTEPFDIRSMKLDPFDPRGPLIPRREK